MKIVYCKECEFEVNEKLMEKNKYVECPFCGKIGKNNLFKP